MVASSVEHAEQSPCRTYGPRRRWLALLAGLLVASPLADHTQAAQELSRPNILIIVADDLGFSDPACFGGEIQTPHLDRLAAGGVRLTRFYSAARCCPSRASILTGQYPHRVGLGHMTADLGRPGYTGRLAPEARTIAQAIQSAGYRSFLSGKWHLGTDDPTRHGFEEFYGTLVSAKTFWDPDHFIRLPADREARRYPEGTFYGTDALTDHALDFFELARETPDRPWFLYLAYNAPHFPLQAPQEDIARYADRYHVGWDAVREQRHERMKALGVITEQTPLTPRSRYEDWGADQSGVNPAWDSLSSDRRADLARRMAIYAAMVDRMDRQIGRVIDDLRGHGELDNTLIIFLSDNGACAEWDPFGFDGKSGPNGELHLGAAIETMGGPGTFHSAGSGWANASNTPWRLYKHYTHEGGIRSPAIVHWPAGLNRAGAVEHRPAHVIDLLATCVDVAGVDAAGSAGPGRSLLPLLRGEPVETRPLFFEHEGHRAVHEGRWKLVALRGGPWELYDVDADPVELHDLATERPRVVAELSEKWDRWAAANHVTPLPSDYGVEYLPKPR